MALSAADLATRIAPACEPFAAQEQAALEPLLQRIGDAEVVLLGEATHGTREFYLLRARITRALVEQKDFRIVAVEADWPDAARIDRWVRNRPDPDDGRWPAFARFPTWMWRNVEVAGFVDWLHDWNRGRAAGQQAGFHGLDLYSMYRSMAEVLEYLDRTDPGSARVARQRYGCLDPWAESPAEYGLAAVTGAYEACEHDVVANLRELLGTHMAMLADGREAHLDAVQNARVVANAERYYRIMYRGSRESWNLRDTHMFETLEQLRRFRRGAKAVVWAHNSHVGNADATEMGAHGELNIGSLSREAWGERAYLVGFGTDRGTVAAASDWDGPRETKTVRPAREDSYEGAMRETGLAGFFLPLRHAPRTLLAELAGDRLERAIGVIYRPETERASHYFHARLPEQFDEFVWIAETSAVTEIEGPHLAGQPELYPFAV
jgi:protein-L-isoaspartate(D-aspartate) O-methyltransferase